MKALKALKRQTLTNYTLRDDQDYVWVRVDSLNLCITRTDEGVVVDIFKAGKEDEPPLTGTWVNFNEAEEEEDWDDEGDS